MMGGVCVMYNYILSIFKHCKTKKREKEEKRNGRGFVVDIEIALLLPGLSLAFAFLD